MLPGSFRFRGVSQYLSESSWISSGPDRYFKMVARSWKLPGNCALCSYVGIWCASCILCLLLVINRILELWKPNLAVIVFQGRVSACACCHPHSIGFILGPTFWFLMTIPLVYGLYFFFFTPPVLFTSRYDSWFFDPFIFENTTKQVNTHFLVAFTFINNLVHEPFALFQQSGPSICHCQHVRFILHRTSSAYGKQ